MCSHLFPSRKLPRCPYCPLPHVWVSLLPPLPQPWSIPTSSVLWSPAWSPRSLEGERVTSQSSGGNWTAFSQSLPSLRTIPGKLPPAPQGAEFLTGSPSSRRGRPAAACGGPGACVERAEEAQPVSRHHPQLPFMADASRRTALSLTEDGLQVGLEVRTAGSPTSLRHLEPDWAGPNCPPRPASNSRLTRRPSRGEAAFPRRLQPGGHLLLPSP